MLNFLKRLYAYFALAIIQPLAKGLTADPSALFGLIAMQTNLNAYACREKATITTTTANASVLTALQAHRSVILLEAGANAGFTLTLPTTAAILAALPSTIPLDGTYAKRIRIVNNNVGQIGTLTAGDASTTITGTATMATNTAREFLFTVTSATTVSYENIGSATL